MVYKWREASRISADAQLVGEEIEQLGYVSARQLVDAAQGYPDSELYKCFEWEDTKAAIKYREDQARDVLGSIQVVLKEAGTEEIVSFRAYEAVTLEPQEGLDTRSMVYIPIADALQGDETRAQVIGRLYRMIDSAKTQLDRYASLCNDLDMVNSYVTRAHSALKEKLSD